MTLTLSSAAFATGDLGRSSVGVQIGFGKVDLGDDESTFSFGVSGTYATVPDPDLFGADITVGYTYADLHAYDTHDFGVTATPYLNISQYFRPYLNVGIGHFSVEDESEFSFKLGIGVEMEFVENWSTSISYDQAFINDFDIGTFGIGTGYWFQSGIGIDIRYEHAEYEDSDFSSDGVKLGAGYSF